MKFMIIFLIICMGFTFALNNLYWYYSSPIRRQIQASINLNDPRILENWSDSIFNYGNTSTSAEINFGE